MRWVLVCLLAATGCQSCWSFGDKPFFGSCDIRRPDAGVPTPPTGSDGSGGGETDSDGGGVAELEDGASESCVPRGRCYETGSECETTTDAGALQCVCEMSGDTFHSTWTWWCSPAPPDLAVLDAALDFADVD